MITMMQRSAAVLAVSALGVGLALILSAAAVAAENEPASPPATKQSSPLAKSAATQDKAWANDGQPHRHRVNKAARKAEAQSAQTAALTMSGQDAFATISEIVRSLEADPSTDWSKVDLEALRQHLIDMNEVTLNAVAVAKPVEGGLEITVTGTGRTVAAIQRMVPAHAKEIDGLNGWSARVQSIPKGTLLRVTASDAKEVKHIRGLGFIGLLVTGSDHQAYHFALAKGESPQKQ